MKNQEKIFVIGHKNPDTDSICSAIAYADIKNRTMQEKKYVPKRAGQINEETQYVLNYFGVQAPGYIGNIGTQVKAENIAAAFYLNAVKRAKLYCLLRAGSDRRAAYCCRQRRLRNGH